jgi:hypothetical protein
MMCLAESGVAAMPRKTKRQFEIGDRLLLPVEVTLVSYAEDPDLDRVTLQLPGYEYPVTIAAHWIVRAIAEQG